MSEIVITLNQVKQEHRIECPDVSLDFFMEHYVKGFFEKYDTVYVKVSPYFKFTFNKYAQVKPS